MNYTKIKNYPALSALLTIWQFVNVFLVILSFGVLIGFSVLLPNVRDIALLGIPNYVFTSIGVFFFIVNVIFTFFSFLAREFVLVYLDVARNTNLTNVYLSQFVNQNANQQITQSPQQPKEIPQQQTPKIDKSDLFD